MRYALPVIDSIEKIMYAKSHMALWTKQTLYIPTSTKPMGGMQIKEKIKRTFEIIISSTPKYCAL